VCDLLIYSLRILLYRARGLRMPSSGVRLVVGFQTDLISALIVLIFVDHKHEHELFVQLLESVAVDA
jgi:hypothetical protein